MAIDLEIKASLDSQVLPWKEVSSRSILGGVAYMAQDKMFAALMEGVVAINCPRSYERER